MLLYWYTVATCFLRCRRSAQVLYVMPARARRPSRKACEAAESATVKREPTEETVKTMPGSKVHAGQRSESARRVKKRIVKKEPRASRPSSVPSNEQERAAAVNMTMDLCRKMEARMLTMDAMARAHVAAEEAKEKQDRMVPTARQVDLLYKEMLKLDEYELGTVAMYVPGTHRDKDGVLEFPPLAEMSNATIARLWDIVMVRMPRTRGEQLAANYSRTLCGRPYKDAKGQTGGVYYDQDSKTIKVRMDRSGAVWTADKVSELIAGVRRAEGYEVNDGSDSESFSDLSSSSDEEEGM